MKKSAASVRRILVVEGDSAVSQVCRRALTNEGFEADK